MIDLDNPADVEALFVRVQARRVAMLANMAGHDTPPLAKKILQAWDAPDGQINEDAIEADNAAYAEWCRRHEVECAELSFSGEIGWRVGAPVIVADGGSQVH